MNGIDPEDYKLPYFTEGYYYLTDREFRQMIAEDLVADWAAMLLAEIRSLDEILLPRHLV